MRTAGLASVWTKVGGKEDTDVNEITDGPEATCLHPLPIRVICEGVRIVRMWTEWEETGNIRSRNIQNSIVIQHTWTRVQNYIEIARRHPKLYDGAAGARTWCRDKGDTISKY
jgi:hypothetical protein